MTAILDRTQAHMPGCRCAEYWPGDDGGPLEYALMVPERCWTNNPANGDTVDPLLAGSLLMALQTAAREAGVPFKRIVEGRRNAAGEPIGPRLESRICEMVEYRLIREQLAKLIEETVQRMVEARGTQVARV